MFAKCAAIFTTVLLTSMLTVRRATALFAQPFAAIVRTTIATLDRFRLLNCWDRDVTNDRYASVNSENSCGW